jgi:hypothetical protein
MDVQPDGTGIETAGWFRSNGESKEKNDESMVMSRLCALHWIIVLYESVVPDVLKADVSSNLHISCLSGSEASENRSNQVLSVFPRVHLRNHKSIF